MTLTPSHPTVSVVIPAHGSDAYLKQCLEALTTQAVPPLEIIVSVDGEDEKLAAAARSYGAKVLVASRQGPAIARNRGAAVAKGDVLLFVDADVVCPPTVVGMVVGTFAKEAEVAAIFGSYDDMPADSGFFSQYRNLLHHYIHQHSNTQAKTFWAGCGAIRREAFKSCGGFSERYIHPAVEDIELGYRMTEAGLVIRLCKRLQVKHLKRWTCYSTLKTDLFTRSLSWSRLLLESKGRYVNDLNMDWKYRSSMAVSLLFIALISDVTLCFSSIMVSAFLLAIWLGLNHHVLKFFTRVKGMWFATRVIPALWMHYICGAAGYMLALAERLSQKIISADGQVNRGA